MDAMSKPWSLAVKAAIFDKAGRCLLVRRSANNTSFVGMWEWPGGKLEPGEDFADGLRREVAEETGLTIEFTGLAGATTFEMPRVNVALLCMTALLVSGEVKISEEHDAFVWIPLDDIPLYEYPPRISELMLEYAKLGSAGASCPP